MSVSDVVMVALVMACLAVIVVCVVREGGALRRSWVYAPSPDGTEIDGSAEPTVVETDAPLASVSVAPPALPQVAHEAGEAPLRKAA